MGDSRRDVSRSTFGRYAYSTKVLHSMQLGCKITQRPLQYRYVDITRQYANPRGKPSDRAAPVRCGCYGGS